MTAAQRNGWDCGGALTGAPPARRDLRHLTPGDPAPHSLVPQGDTGGHIEDVPPRSIDAADEQRAVASAKAVRDSIGPNVGLFLAMSAEPTTDAITRLGRQFGGERIYPRDGFRRIMELRAADFPQPDGSNAGCIMGRRRWRPWPGAYNMRIAPPRS